MSEQPARYQRSASGMVGALVVTLLVIGAYVGFRALNRSPLDVGPGHVNYLAQVGYAQQAGATLVYPARLPHGWTATEFQYDAGATAPTGAARPDVQLSMLTGSQDYVGLVQAPTPIPELLSTYVDANASAGPALTLRGAIATHWTTWTDSGGDTALATRWHRQSLMVFGTADRAELTAFARSLTARKR